MPKFFFSSRDSTGTVVDEEGTELDDTKDAHTHAILLAGELIKELALSQTDDTALAIWVTDGDGKTVCSIDFSAACEGSGLEQPG